MFGNARTPKIVAGHMVTASGLGHDFEGDRKRHYFCINFEQRLKKISRTSDSKFAAFVRVNNAWAAGARVVEPPA
jgi:hypothetical protein